MQVDRLAVAAGASGDVHWHERRWRPLPVRVQPHGRCRVAPDGAGRAEAQAEGVPTQVQAGAGADFQQGERQTELLGHGEAAGGQRHRPGHFVGLRWPLDEALQVVPVGVDRPGDDPPQGLGVRCRTLA